MRINRLYEKLHHTFSAREQAEYEKFQEFIDDNYYEQMEQVDYSFVAELYSWYDEFSDPAKYLHALNEELNLHLTESDFMNNDMNEDQILTGARSWLEYNKPELIELVLPDSITEIEDYIFQGCSNLGPTIKIPEGVNYIGENAFHNCINLTNIHLPDSVININCNAFDGCNKLENITIPNAVEFIGEGTFWGCTKLKNINIPNSVEFIGDSAFHGCNDLIIHTKNPYVIRICKCNDIKYIEE